MSRTAKRVQTEVDTYIIDNEFEPEGNMAVTDLVVMMATGEQTHDQCCLVS